MPGTWVLQIKMYKRCCTITDCNRDISGIKHTKIQRSDGFCFFLDQAFLTLLKNINCESVADKVVACGADQHEVPQMIHHLLDYGLLEKEVDGDRQ